LTPTDATVRDAWEERFIDFLHGHDLIMTRRDAISVVTTVLRELIDNVFEHAAIGESAASQAPAALVAGLNVREARYVAWKKGDGLYPANYVFNEWLIGRDTPLVRILVADSGVGIPMTLTPSYRRRMSRPRARSITSGELILHSFEPSASRHEGDRRGLGLAAVGRFVRGYSGRVAIRSGNANGGFWYPQVAAEAFVDEALAYVPGTVVDVTLGKTIGGHMAPDVVAPVTQRKAASLIFARSAYTRSRQDNFAAVVVEALKGNNDPHPVVVLMVSGWSTTRPDRIDLALEVRRAAKDLERRAGLIVVLPEASKVDIRSTFAPLDELGEADVSSSQVWDLAEWTPPALIVAADGSPTWTGGSERVRKLLYSLLDGEAIDLDRVVRTFVRRSSEHDYLLAERDWLAVDDGGSAAFRVSSALINELIARQVEASLAREVARSGYDSTQR
jgi:hypothetical protein